MLIPSIELIIGFIGSTIGVAICIMFPASCFIKVCQKNSTEKMLAQFLLIFGFVLMVLGTYTNLSAIDEKSSGNYDETHNILKHVDEAIERSSMNLSKQLAESPEIDRVTSSNLESDLKQIPDQFETIPKLPDAAKPKYHEKPVEGLNVIELPRKDSTIPKVSDTEVKVVPLVVNDDDKPLAKPDETKKSNDINKEAIQKEEQEIAIEKNEQNADDAQSELKRLEETKKLLEEVKEIKNVLEKQNQETQQLVLQKFDEIVDKVEKIEKVQEEDNKKHGEEKIEANLLNEKKLVEQNVVQTLAPEKTIVRDDEKPVVQSNIVTNQTGNGPIISLLSSNKQVNQVETLQNLSQGSDVVDSKVKTVKDSKAEEEHAAIQRDLLNVETNDELDRSADVDEKVSQSDLLRHKRQADENCPKPIDESKLSMPEDEKFLPNVKLSIDDGIGMKIMGGGRDLKSVEDK